MFKIIGGTNQLDLRIEDWEKDIKAGNYWELVALPSIVKRFQPKTIFEFGTGHGRSTLQMAINSDDDAVIYSLDITKEHPVGCILENKKVNSKIKHLLGDSLTFDYSPYQSKVDFVFLDGCHHYEHVLSDSENALKIIKPGGIILWDDFSPAWPGVVKALKKLQSKIEVFRIPGTSFVIHAPQQLRSVSKA